MRSAIITGEDDPHCGHSLRYIVSSEKSLANGDVRFWCTQPHNTWELIKRGEGLLLG